jgi:leader peptidase (prepilin peptidase) / N-methyltransferase
MGECLEAIALLSQSPAAFAAVALLLGLVVGSFLNVVIYRLPVMLERDWRRECAALDGRETPAEPVFNLVVPRSRCPACGTQILARHNVPVVSWLLLRGRCAACGAAIALRYPLVELATGLLSALVAWHFGFGFAGGAALAITWTLVALTGIDVDQQLLPDSLTLPLLWCGLLASLWHVPGSASALPVAPRDAIIGAAAGYLFLRGVYEAFKLLTGKEGMGFGDFKLFAALGAWMGWQMLPLVLLLSAVVGAVVGVGMIVLRGRDRQVPMPFGPYLAGAGFIAMLWGPQLVDRYLAAAGLR